MRRAGALAAVTVAVLGALAGLADASAHRDRPPNMAAMTVLPSDLAPGALLSQQGYVHAPPGFRAEYSRSFAIAQAAGGGPRFALDAVLALAPSTALARRAVVEQRRLYASRAGRGLLGGELVAAARGADARVRSGVQIQRPGGLGAGEHAFYVAATVRTAGRVRRAAFAEFEVGPVAATLTLVSPSGSGPTRAIVAALARDVVSHVTLVLSSTILTGSPARPTRGPSGASGSSGASGASGSSAAGWRVGGGGGVFSPTGPSGASGPSGSSGPTGPTGPSGGSGPTGPSAPTGGTSGPSGPTGGT